MCGRHDQPGKLIPADQYLLRNLSQRPEHLIATNSIPDFLEHLYEPFSQEKRPGYEGTGTGLGLAVIKKILDDHGARVRLVNRAEGGAMVEIEFPLGDEVREGGRDG